MLLNAANIYSLYGTVPEITRLFASELIQKLLYENGYEPKEYRKSLWQTMSFFILSLVFAALSGRASIAHMYFEYQNICAMAGVRPASQRTVERSMEQAESIPLMTTLSGRRIKRSSPSHAANHPQQVKAQTL